MIENETMQILTEKVNEYANNQKQYLNKFILRLMPTFIAKTERGGYHKVAITRISTGGSRSTLTGGRSKIIRLGEMYDFKRQYKAHKFAVKVRLDEEDADDPDFATRAFSTLEIMRTQDIKNFLLYGVKGQKPVKNGYGDNLNGGLLNLKGSSTETGKIENVEDLMLFCEKMVSTIKNYVDLSQSGFETDKGLKLFTLVAPVSSGIDNMQIKIAGTPIKLTNLLWDLYQIDVLPVKTTYTNKFVLVPYTKEFNYFHIDTYNKLHQYNEQGGDLVVELFHKSAGIISSKPEIIVSKATTGKRLEGSVDWKDINKVEIVNKEINVKTDKETDKETKKEVEEATKKANSNK